MEAKNIPQNRQNCVLRSILMWMRPIIVYGRFRLHAIVIFSAKSHFWRIDLQDDLIFCMIILLHLYNNRNFIACNGQKSRVRLAIFKTCKNYMVSEQYAKISKPSRNGCYKDEKWIRYTIQSTKSTQKKNLLTKHVELHCINPCHVKLTK